MSKVIIEVSGGVATVTQCPDYIEVEIIDHDEEDCGTSAKVGDYEALT